MFCWPSAPDALAKAAARLGTQLATSMKATVEVPQLTDREAQVSAGEIRDRLLPLIKKMEDTVAVYHNLVRQSQVCSSCSFDDVWAD